MRASPLARIWPALLASALLVALTWFSSTRRVSSQELVPRFDPEECPEPLSGYVKAERGHKGHLQTLICLYHKVQAGDPPLENSQDLWLTHYSTAEEAAEEMSRYVADEYAGKFSCDTWDDCDRIDRVQFERTDSSLSGALITLTREPVFYDLERRLVYGTHHITIFVRGQAFSSLEEAKAEVAELETAAKAVVDAPHEMVPRLASSGGEPTGEATGEAPEPAPDPTEEAAPAGPEIDGDKVGMACDEYCKSLDPIGLGLPGTTYPDCACDCGPGNAFVGLDCVPCSEMCTGSDTFLYEPYQMKCTCLCDDPQEIWSYYLASCVTGPDRTGLDCETYCAEMVSAGVGRPDKTFPDCNCDCPPGQLFLEEALQCVPCESWCSGEGTRLITDKDRPCACMCTDPGKKYDPVARECVGLDGSECNEKGGCEPEYGENCLNCSDCGCSWATPANRAYDQYFACEPAHPDADIYGCVFNTPSEAEQLQIMGEEWKHCRDAWLIMLWANSMPTEVEQVFSKLSSLEKISTWQKKSGCVPTQDGVVLGREAVDPLVCLMRYCDRINAGIHELEQQVEGQTPVIRGPGIKYRPAGATVSTGQGQTVNFEGRIDIFGNVPGSLRSPLGEGHSHSEYEIAADPETGMEIYLFDGQYTHTYYDPAEDAFKQETLGPGEILVIDFEGVPVSRSTFDPASRDPWWESVEYLVNCPENATQQGPDCFCDLGFEVDVHLERCLPVEGAEPEPVPEEGSTEVVQAETEPPPLIEITVAPDAQPPAEAEGEGSSDTTLLWIVLAVVGVLVVVVLVLLIVVLRGQR